MMAQGDIFKINLDDAFGHEQDGYRRGIAIQATSFDLPTLLVVPTTGQVQALRFPNTFLVQPSSKNGLTSASVVLAFQLRALDKRRIVERVGQLEQNHLDRLIKELNLLLGVSPQ